MLQPHKRQSRVHGNDEYKIPHRLTRYLAISFLSNHFAPDGTSDGIQEPMIENIHL